MMLSEAIRLGSLLHPQAFGTYISWQGDTIVATCVMAAARMALGDEAWTAALQRVGWNNPAFSSLQCRMIHLNDGLRWTREAIADWLVVSGQDVELTPDNDESGTETRAQGQTAGAGALSHVRA